MEENKGMKNNADQQFGKCFWKEVSKPLPGRPTLKINSTRQSQNVIRSYQQFQQSVEDAWSFKEDDPPKQQVSVGMIDKAEISLVHSTGERFIKNKTDQDETKSDFKTCSSDLVTSSNLPPTDVDNLITLSKKFSTNSVISKALKFQLLMESSLPNLDKLRVLSWSGIPPENRPDVWRLLAGYLPVNIDRRKSTLDRKRLEYWNLVGQYFNSKRSDAQEDTYRQIQIDIPRMSPASAMFQQKTIQTIFERILFTWAVRHPASGYVQGMNDLVTPFFIVFVKEFLPHQSDLESVNFQLLPEEQLKTVEADSFWCFSKLLDGIQDNYIFAQLGIQLKVNQLKELTQRVDGVLHKHLEEHEINFIQFSFRWMNNLLTRELTLNCCVRLWDTLLAELDDLATFQLYISAAFLLHWRERLLQEQDFPGLITFLQNPPTQKWTDSDVGMLLADAHRLKYMFADSPKHFQNTSG